MEVKGSVLHPARGGAKIPAVARSRTTWVISIYPEPPCDCRTQEEAQEKPTSVHMAWL